jgi:electron transport complex protein RnfG
MGLKNSNIFQAWLVLLLCMCFGSALAAVHVVLSPAIEENKTQETLARVPELVPDGDTLKPESLEIVPQMFEVEKIGRSANYAVYEAMAGGRRIGWVVKSAGQGYADRIELLVGIDADAQRISGLYILDQKETPGLGNKVAEIAWREQFKGKTAVGELVVTKSGATAPEEIDAVTGATISSRSVVQIVNTALGDVRPLLTEGN